MKLSDTELELIAPEIFNDAEGVKAWFSCKNSHLDVEGQKIAGLNLGYNTAETGGMVDIHRSRLLSHLQINPDRIAYAGQIHSNHVERVSRGGTFENTDALVTDVQGLTLAIQVADCAAVLLADPLKHVVGAAHAGWRGAAGDILPKTVTNMVSMGAVEKNIRAFVSPCISQEHFEVGNEVAEQFPDAFVDYTNYRKPHVNLKEFLENQLFEAGILKTHIEVHKGCTVNDKRYYSYRREQQKSGRMLGLIRFKL